MGKGVFFGLVLVFWCGVVLADSYYSDLKKTPSYLIFLKRWGIMIGYPDGTFRGEKTASKFEVAASIWRMSNYLEIQREYPPIKPKGFEDLINELNGRLALLQRNMVNIRGDYKKSRIERVFEYLSGWYGLDDYHFQELRNKVALKFSGERDDIRFYVQGKMQKDLADGKDTLGVLKLDKWYVGLKNLRLDLFYDYITKIGFMPKGVLAGYFDFLTWLKPKGAVGVEFGKFRVLFTLGEDKFEAGKRTKDLQSWGGFYNLKSNKGMLNVLVWQKLDSVGAKYRLDPVFWGLNYRKDFRNKKVVYRFYLSLWHEEGNDSSFEKAVNDFDFTSSKYLRSINLTNYKADMSLAYNIGMAFESQKNSLRVFYYSSDKDFAAPIPELGVFKTWRSLPSKGLNAIPVGSFWGYCVKKKNDDSIYLNPYVYTNVDKFWFNWDYRVNNRVLWRLFYENFEQAEENAFIEHADFDSYGIVFDYTYSKNVKLYFYVSKYEFDESEYKDYAKVGLQCEVKFKL